MLRKCEIHSEVTAVVDNFLTELLKKTWLLINPKKRWRKSDPSSWAQEYFQMMCLTCTNYAQATAEKKKELEDAYLAHQERKKTCNKEKEKDKIRANLENSFSSVTFDLQAVLQIPTCDVGLLYYSRKLCLYNLTVYEAGLRNDAYCFPWSEVNGKKGSCEIGTILLYYLTNCVPENITEISLFSDTCGGQNRNQFIAALLLWAVQKIGHLKVIEHSIWHSHMEADSMHSSIETAKKNAAIYSMMDWISIFKRARRKKFKSGLSRTNNNNRSQKRDLINLCRKGIIPEELVATVATGGHGWFENMETEKRSDRLPEPAIGESESEETD
ncbi:hypothetical protein ACJJTC_017022 [Scirpophaga incertulas]